MDPATLKIAAESNVGLRPGSCSPPPTSASTPPLTSAHVGVIGTTYRLDISAEGKTLSAQSTIPNPVQLDSVWFKLALQSSGDDSLGYAWARITDPDTTATAIAGRHSASTTAQTGN
jgi:hypothetical protein